MKNHTIKILEPHPPPDQSCDHKIQKLKFLRNINVFIAQLEFSLVDVWDLVNLYLQYRWPSKLSLSWASRLTSADNMVVDFKSFCDVR